MYKIFKNFIVDNVNHIKKISISDLLNSITLAILFFMTNVSLLYIESGMYSEIIEYLAIIFIVLVFVVFMTYKNIRISHQTFAFIGFIYLFFQLVFTFLSATVNLYQENFNLRSYFSSHLFSIPLLCFYTLFFISYNGVKESNLYKQQETVLSNFLYEKLFAIFSLTTFFLQSNVIKFYLDTVYVVTANYLDIIVASSLFLLTYFLIGNVISTYIINAFDNLLNKKMAIPLVYVFSVTLAILVNFFIQFSIQTINIGFDSTYYFFLGSIFQVLILSILFILLYFIINRFFIATISIIIISVIFIITNHLKFQLRNEPVLPSDLVWLRQIDLLFGFVDTTYLVIFVLVVGFVGCLFYYIIKSKRDVKIFSKIVNRIAHMAVLIVIAISIIFSMQSNSEGKIKSNIPVLSRLVTDLDIDWKGNSVVANIKSLSFVWINQLVTPIMEKPKNYSSATIKDLIEKYTQRASEINESRQNYFQDQTIIYVLSESFSDPNRIPGTEISRDIIPNINNYKSQYTSGLMKSNGYGGGTANMEFQTLTGLAMNSFSPSVSTLNTEVVPKMDYLPGLSNYFDTENKVAIHLESGLNYSRSSVYKKMGFSTFIGTSNAETIVTDFDKVGVFPSDAASYRYVLENLNAKPQFISLITMQNHIPWSIGDPADILATNQYFTEKENDVFTSYVRLLNHTDTATKDFLDKLSTIDKNITVLFYGDHLPSLYSSENFTENPRLQYLTDYFIWSNFETQKLEYPVVNSYDFTALLLETTNSKVTPYFALLTDVLHETDEYGNIDAESQVLKDFQLIQYDLIRTNGYIKQDSDFFKLGD